MVDDLLAELGRKHAFRERHADGGRNTLPERSGGRLDALGVKILGMSGRQRAQLAEVLDLVKRHVRITGEVEQRIEQHRAVTGRENESVTVRPVRSVCIELQKLR